MKRVARESGGTWNAPLSRAGFSRPQWPPRNDTRSRQATGSRPRNKGEFGELQKKQKQPLGCVYCRCAGSMTSTVAVAAITATADDVEAARSRQTLSRAELLRRKAG